jgi:hypothetical protein
MNRGTGLRKRPPLPSPLLLRRRGRNAGRETKAVQLRLDGLVVGRADHSDLFRP